MPTSMRATRPQRTFYVNQLNEVNLRIAATKQESVLNLWNTVLSLQQEMTPELKQEVTNILLTPFGESVRSILLNRIEYLVSQAHRIPESTKRSTFLHNQTILSIYLPKCRAAQAKTQLGYQLTYFTPRTYDPVAYFITQLNELYQKVEDAISDKFTSTTTIENIADAILANIMLFQLSDTIKQFGSPEFNQYVSKELTRCMDYLQCKMRIQPTSFQVDSGSLFAKEKTIKGRSPISVTAAT